MASQYFLALYRWVKGNQFKFSNNTRAMWKFFMVILLLIASIVAALLIRNDRLNKFDENSKLPSFIGLAMGSDISENIEGTEFPCSKYGPSDSAQRCIFKWVNLDSAGLKYLDIEPVYFHYYKNKLFRIEIKIGTAKPKYAYFKLKLDNLLGIRYFGKEYNLIPIDYKTAKKAMNQKLGEVNSDVWDGKDAKVSLYKFTEQDIQTENLNFWYVIEYRSKIWGLKIKELPRFKEVHHMPTQ